MHREKAFILNLCKYNAPDAALLNELSEMNLDYPYVLGQLLYNRLGGAAWYSMERVGLTGKVNREFRTTLKTIYETNIIKGESLTVALEYLGGILQPADFPYALLKGSYLLGLYPKGIRTSNDIDILIKFQRHIAN